MNRKGRASRQLVWSKNQSKANYSMKFTNMARMKTRVMVILEIIVTVKIFLKCELKQDMVIEQMHQKHAPNISFF